MAERVVEDEKNERLPAPHTCKVSLGPPAPKDSAYLFLDLGEELVVIAKLEMILSLKKNCMGLNKRLIVK